MTVRTILIIAMLAAVTWTAVVTLAVCIGAGF